MQDMFGEYYNFDASIGVYNRKNRSKIITTRFRIDLNDIFNDVNLIDLLSGFYYDTSSFESIDLQPQCDFSQNFDYSATRFLDEAINRDRISQQVLDTISFNIGISEFDKLKMLNDVIQNKSSFNLEENEKFLLMNIIWN